MKAMSNTNLQACFQSQTFSWLQTKIPLEDFTLSFNNQAKTWEPGWVRIYYAEVNIGAVISWGKPFIFIND